MKSTGIVRKIDELGRIVLPIELRRTLGMEIKDPVEIFTEGNMVVLRKYENSCCICGNSEMDGAEMLNDRMICADCIKVIRK